MRRLMLAAALSGSALMAGYGTAAAQVAVEIPGAGLYIGPTYHYDDDYYYDDGPTVYRYRHYRHYRYYDDSYRTRSHQRRVDRSTCPRHHYWDGNACQLGRRP
jgi:hypothetical protein